MKSKLSAYSALVFSPLEVQSLLQAIERIPGTRVLTLSQRSAQEPQMVVTLTPDNELQGASLDEFLSALGSLLDSAGGLLIRQRMTMAQSLPYHTPTSWDVLYGARTDGGAWYPVVAEYLLQSRGPNSVDFDEEDKLPILCGDLHVFCTADRVVVGELSRAPRVKGSNS